MEIVIRQIFQLGLASPANCRQSGNMNSCKLLWDVQHSPMHVLCIVCCMYLRCVTKKVWYVTTELVCVTERDVVQLQCLSGVVRNVLAVGFAPHMTLCHHGIRLDLVARG